MILLHIHVPVIIFSMLSSSAVKGHLDDLKASNRTIDQTFEVFPNPGSGEFNISYELSSTQEVSILLVDALGKIYREFKTAELQFSGKHQLTVRLDGLPNGWYQCILKTGDKWESASILKMDK